MKCLIICSSVDVLEKTIDELKYNDYFVISVDGGLKICEKYNIVPDLWVGDMDSLATTNTNVKNKIVFPSDKNMTDSHIAVCEALKRGYFDITIIGATGGRLDHEFSNYCLLKFILENNGFGKIINTNNFIVMANSNIEIPADDMKYISFYPFDGQVQNFSVLDVKYPLMNHLLKNNDSYTTSNEFLKDKSAKVFIDSGYVLIICSKDI